MRQLVLLISVVILMGLMSCSSTRQMTFKECTDTHFYCTHSQITTTDTVVRLRESSIVFDNDSLRICKLPVSNLSFNLHRQDSIVFPLTQVTTIHATVKNTVSPVVIGTFVGIVSGALGGASIAGYKQQNEKHTRNSNGYILGGIIGGILGGGIGYLSGEDNKTVFIITPDANSKKQ